MGASIYKNKKPAIIFLIPAFLFMIVYLYYPFLQNIWNSFQNIRQLGSSGEGFLDPWYSNYVEMFHDEVMWISLKNTLIMMLVTLVGHRECRRHRGRSAASVGIHALARVVGREFDAPDLAEHGLRFGIGNLDVSRAVVVAPLDNDGDSADSAREPGANRLCRAVDRVDRIGTGCGILQEQFIGRETGSGHGCVFTQDEGRLFP